MSMTYLQLANWRFPLQLSRTSLKRVEGIKLKILTLIVQTVSLQLTLNIISISSTQLEKSIQKSLYNPTYIKFPTVPVYHKI